MDMLGFVLVSLLLCMFEKFHNKKLTNNKLHSNVPSTE